MSNPLGLAGRLVLACAAVPAVLFAWATPVAAAGGGGVGAGPAPGAPGVLAGSGYFAPTLAPGSTWSSSLLVSNDSGTAGPIMVYAADGLTSTTSGAAYSDAGQPLRSAGAWVQPQFQAVSVPAQGQATVKFSVTVPPSATPGDHLAGIVAQPESPVESGSGQIRVNVVARSVVAVLIRVPGPASFAVRVGKPTIGPGPDQIGEVVTPVTDSGQVIGRPVNHVTLDGPNGYQKSVTRQIDTLLPGGAAHFAVYWPDRLHGAYQITSCVSGSGLRQPVCNSATVVVDGTTNTVIAHRPGPAHGGAHLPGWAVAMISALAGALLAVLVLRRRGSSRDTSDSSPQPDPSPDPEPGSEERTQPDADPEGRSLPVVR